MIDPNYCQLMARYNCWMNRKLFACCAQLSEVQRREDRALFFKSIHGTLNHLLFGDLAWLSRFVNRLDEIPELGAELYSDIDELVAARETLDQRIIDWADEIDEAWLASDFSFTSKAYNQTFSNEAWVYVTHMFNHGTHHRGQLTSALSQLGIDYGPTDLPVLPDELD